MKLPSSLLLLSLLAACDGGEKPEDSGDTATGDTDTADTSEPDVVPVWEEHRVETSSTLQGIYASGEGVYVVGTGGKAWVGGATDAWASMDPEVDENDLTDLWGSGAGTTLELVAPAKSGYVARFTGGAWTVEDLGTSNHEGIGGSGIEALFAVGWGGIYRFDGAAWTFEAPPNNERLNDVYGVGEEAIAVGEEGAIVRRAAIGTWEAQDAGVSVNLNGVAGVSVDDVWAVGDEGTVVHWDGAAWTVVDAGTTASLWAVFAPSATAVYVVGNNGTALRWDGAAFEELPTGVDNNLYAIHGVSADNVWAVGNRGMAIQYKAAAR